jgi:ABC-type lipoprotein export system ATPase subunit
MPAPADVGGAPALVVEGLSHAYDDPEGGRTEVLRVPRLELARGATLAVTGESGSGKTTLLHLVAGILPVQSGRLRVAGESLEGLGEGARDRLRARHVGYVFQAFHLLPGLTALENVALGLSFRPRGAGLAPRQAAREALARVGLGDRAHHRPGQLSTGQQQRVAVARALAGRPTLVLADEPTASLDRARADEALDLLISFAAECGAALLVVTHDAAALARFPVRHALASPAGAATR